MPDLCPGCDSSCPARGLDRYCRPWRARLATLARRAEIAETHRLMRLAGECPDRRPEPG